MTLSLKNIGETLFKGYIILVFIWIGLALSCQTFMLYLHFTNQEDRSRNISNQIAWKIDGTFKNNPDNIWFKEPKTK